MWREFNMYFPFMLLVYLLLIAFLNFTVNNIFWTEFRNFLDASLMGLTKDYLKFSHAGTCGLIGSPYGAVQSVDGVICAVITAECVSFYNMRTLDKINEIRRDSKIVTSFHFNSDKSAIAIGYNDGELHLHNRQKESSQIVFAGHRTGVNCIAFSSDGFMLASGGKDSAIVIWDVLNQSGIFRLTGHKGTITQLKFLQKDKYLISSSKDSRIKFWCMSSKSCFFTLADSTSEIYTFALLNSDRLLLVGNAEIELTVFQLDWVGQTDLDYVEESQSPKRMRDNGDPMEDPEKMDNQANQILKCLKRGTLMRQAKGRALQISVSTDECLICCLGADSLMDVYRHFTEEESQKRYNKKLRKMRQRIEETNSDSFKKLEVEVRRDITTLITRIGDFRADSKIKWVDFCDSFLPIDNEKSREYRVYCLLKSNDVQGVALRVDWKSNAIQATSLVSLGQQAHRTDVRILSISSDGSMFVSGALESAITWQMDDFHPMNKLMSDGMHQISALTILAADQALVIGTKVGSFFTFHLKTCELIETLENAHEAAISEIAAFSNKNEFLSCGHDKLAKFWQLEICDGFQGEKFKIRQKRVLELPEEALCAAISQNNKFIAFGLLDNTARIYYNDSLKFFISLYGHSLPIHSIDISSDSKLVVTGSADKSVKIWGLDFGDCHKSMFAHEDIVTCVRFCKAQSDERLFWSAGRDGKLKQWDAAKFIHIQSLEGHTDQIDSIVLSFDGRVLISASRDKSIRIWELTDEIIVIQEEEEKIREKEYEQKLMEEEEIIPGEAREQESSLAPLKNMDSIKSAENLIEAMEIISESKLGKEQNPEMYTPHVLLKGYPSNSEHLFLLDTIQKIRPSHLEKSLLSIPFTYIGEMLAHLCKCLRVSYKSELASRIIIFVLRIHHNEITHSVELLPIIDGLKGILGATINIALNVTGLNIAALKYMQMDLEERQNTSLFNLNAVELEKEAKKRKRNKKRNFAIVKPLHFDSF